MALSRVMSAFVALAIAGGWNSIPAAAQGIEPVSKPAAAKSKSAEKKSSAKAAKPEGKTDPEASNKALEAGIKSYTSGKYEPAIASLNSALQGGGLPSHRVARALYYRGMAHRKSGKSAQAIADLKGALWLGNGLSDSERAEATAQHAAAYKDAGLGEAPPVAHSAVESTEPARSAAAAPASPAGAPAAKSSGGWQATTASSGTPSHAMAPADASTSASAPAAPSSGSGIGGFFSSIFGGGSTAPTAAPAPAAPRPVTTASTGPAAQVSSWAESTSVEPSKSAKPVKPTVAIASETKKEAAGATSPAAGKYRLEVGTTTSRDEAEKMARRLRAEHAGEIASRELAIDEGKFGASRYYRVGIGPFANADEPGKLCAALKAKGMDCLVVTR